MCDHCGKGPPKVKLLVAMEPGRDGKDWFLCVEDWADGLRKGPI